MANIPATKVILSLVGHQENVTFLFTNSECEKKGTTWAYANPDVPLSAPSNTFQA